MSKENGEGVIEPGCTIKLDRQASGKTAFYIKTNENTTEDEVDKAIASAEYGYDKLSLRFKLPEKEG